MLRVILVAAVVLPAPTIAQAPPPHEPMVGGGEVSLARAGETLRVTVTGPRPGLASLCLAEDSRVRILHASAAVGEAVYEAQDVAWTLRSNFVWKLRDAPDAATTDADRSRVLGELGWVANPDNTGTRPREFTVHLPAHAVALGVTFLTTGDPMAVSYWPPTMDDACRDMKVAQGYLPDTARFRPATWHQLRAVPLYDIK